MDGSGKGGGVPMEPYSLEELAANVRAGWQRLPAFYRGQALMVMEPMVALLEALVKDAAAAKQEREQLVMALAVAVDGLKAASCSSGANSTCAAPGSQGGPPGACCTVEGAPGASCAPGSSETSPGRGGDNGE